MGVAEIDNWLTWLTPCRVSRVRECELIDWGRVVELSISHHVAAALYIGLRSNGLLGRVPANEIDALKAAYQQGKLNAMVWSRALGMVLPALTAEGVVAVPFKGAALAFLSYSDAATRTMSDIDLWIDDKEMAFAQRALENLGFEQREITERPIAQQSHYDGEIPYSGRRIGVPLVELHWGVFAGEWLCRTTLIDRQGVRERRQMHQLLGHPVELLAPEDHLIQVAIHLSINHTFSMAAVRCLLDLVVIANAGLSWPTVVERAKEWRVASVVGHTFAIAGEMYQHPALSGAAQQLISPRRLRLALLFSNPQSVLAHKQLDKSWAKWVYLTLIVDRNSDRFNLIWRAIWPESVWLTARYGRPGMHVRLRHILGAFRGQF